MELELLGIPPEITVLRGQTVQNIVQSQAKLTAKQIYEWLEQPCMTHFEHYNLVMLDMNKQATKRWDCPECRQELKKAGE